MICIVIEDDDVRRACIDAAQRQSKPPAQAEQETPQQAQPVQQPEQQPIQQAQPVQQPEQERTQPVAPPQPTITERLIGGKSQANRASRAEPLAQDPLPPEPPAEFSGNVSRIYQSILDRQIIAVDATYLFESDRASHARLEVGERVEVTKVSSRFRSGRTWRITGPSRTSITAYRIHCERENLRADDRRKCARMLDR